MPTNVSPEYKKAEAEYKKARDPADRLKWLREMLSTIPKHKGTEHVQADIKSRIKVLTDELAGPKKGGARTGPVQAVRPEGAAQVSLIGPPNAGKSALHARLTGSHAVVGPYPFTTHEPLPGMLSYRDVHFQLIDLPPISAEYMEKWYLNALQPAHCALLVVDLADPECIDHIVAIRERLDQRRVTLDERWPFPFDEAEAPEAVVPDSGEEETREGEEMEDPFRIVLPTLLVANKSDLDSDPEEVAVLEELLGVRYPAVSVSAETGAGLDRIGPLLFAGLGVVRVYTKVPGKEPSDKPWALFRGGTVQEVAEMVHRDIAEGLHFAKVWGASVLFDGQQVGADHVLADGDVVELHA